MFGILAIYTIYTLFMMGLITKLYGLTTVFADNGTKWFGGVSANLGEYAAVGSAETAGKLQNIGGSAGNAWGAQSKPMLKHKPKPIWVLEHSRNLTAQNKQWQAIKLHWG